MVLKLKTIHVPFTEKDEAKALGARWSAENKTWYVPANLPIERFAKWTEPLKGLVRTEQLFVDMLPRTAWFSNLRSEVTKEEWDAVKKKTFAAAGYRCQACLGKGPQHPVECHERWRFDLDAGDQVLVKTVALCPDCHEATHFGLAQVKGRDDAAIAHLMKVNEWSRKTAIDHVNQAIDIAVELSRWQWRMDARWLLNFVPLSDETRDKIFAHAEGRAERTIKDWQQRIVAE